jgi:hypothetical protein
MKKSVFLTPLLAAAGLSIPTLQAGVLDVSVATVTTEILSSATSPAAAGTPIRVGVFGDVPANAGWADLVANFTEYGSVAVGDGVGGTPGFAITTFTIDDTVTSVGAVPEQLGVLIGDESGYGALTDPAWQTQAFTDPPTPPNLTAIQISSGNTAVVGGAGVFTPGGGITNPTAVPDAFVLVPEPGVGSLALLAGLGFLFRRRR